MQKARIAKVSFDLPVFRLFDYRIPAELAQQIKVGHRVLVPFGKTERIGIVLGTAGYSAHRELKTVIELLDPEPVFSRELLKLARWISSYYFAPEGKVLKSMLPPAVRKKKEEPRKQQYLMPKENIASETLCSLQKKDHDRIPGFFSSAKVP